MERSVIDYWGYLNMFYLAQTSSVSAAAVQTFDLIAGGMLVRSILPEGGSGETKSQQHTVELMVLPFFIPVCIKYRQTAIFRTQRE